MAVKIGPVIKVEGERDYRQSMREITAETKKLKSEMDLLSSSFSSEGKTLAQNQKEQRNLEKQIELTEKALKTQQARLMEVATATNEDGERTQDLKNKTAEFQAVVNNTEKELNELKAQLAALPNSLQLVGDKFQNAGAKMKEHGRSVEQLGMTLTKLSAPLIAAGAAAVKFGAEFDAGMSNVKAVMNTTEEGLGRLREAAISWGEKTVYSAKDVSDALYYMGLAGWSDKEAIESLGGVLNLAAAGNLDLARTSDIVTDGMTALGIAADGYTNGVSNAEHFSNVLAATMSNTNTTVDMLGEAFKYVAPVAGSLGYNIEDLNLALGLMANSGIKGSSAGTTLRNILNRMAKPTKESAEAMNALGVSLDDGSGNMLSFLDVLKDLRSGLGDVNELTKFKEIIEDLDIELEDGCRTQEEYDEAIEELISTSSSAAQAEKLRYAAMLAGTRGMSGLLAIATATDEEFNELSQTLYGADDAFEGLGYAAGMAETQMDNLKGDFTKLTSAIGTSKIKISDLVNGPLRKLVQSITDLVVKFNKMDDAQAKQILKWAALAVAIGPSLVAIGKVEQGIGGLVTGLGKGITAVGSFNKAMKNGEGIYNSLIAGGLNPLTLGVYAVIAAFAAAMVTMKKHNDFIDEYVTGQYKLTEAQEELAASVENSANKYANLNESMRDKGQSIEQEYAQIEALKLQYNELVNATGQIDEANQAQADTILNQLASALGLEIEQVRELIQENGQLDAAIDEVIAKKKQEAILEAYHDDYVQALKDQKTAQTELAQALADKNTADQAVRDTEAQLVAAQEAYNRATTDGTEHLASYVDSITNAELALAQAKETQEAVNETFTTAQETLDNYTATIGNYEAFEAAVVSGTENIAAAQEALINNLKTAENSNRESLEQQYKDAVQKYELIKSAYDEGASGVTELAVAEAKKLVDLSKKELDKLPGEAESAAKGTGSKVASGIASEKTVAVNSAAKMKNEILEALKEGDTTGIGYNLASGLSTGINNAAQGVIGRARSLISDAISAMKREAAIYSPSHITRDEVGKMMARGISKGFEAEEQSVDNSAKELIGSAITAMTTAAGNIPFESNLYGLPSPDTALMDMAGAQSAINKNISAPISVNVNINGSVQDAAELANEIAQKINEQIMRRNEVFS